MCRRADAYCFAAHEKTDRHLFKAIVETWRRSLPASVVSSLSAIIAASVMNEFFAEGVTKAVECLAGIRETFPGQTMLIADYYGDGKSTGRSSSKKMAFHNFIQIVSGQGVPPANLSGWKKIYKGAGCHFIHAVQLQDSPYFIHVLKL